MGFCIVLSVLLLAAFGLRAWALSANAEVSRYVDQELRTFPVAASVVIYKGALVGTNPAGYLKPFELGDVFRGIAYEKVTGTSTAGAVTCRVYTVGDFEVTYTGAAVADTNKALYALTDDATSGTGVGLTGHPDAYMGRVLGYTASSTLLFRLKAPGEKPPVDGTSIDINIDFAQFKFAANDEAAVSYPVPWLLNTNVGAGLTAGTTGLLRDETTGEAKLLLDNDNEAQNVTLETPQVFNVTKGLTFEMEGRNSVAGGAATDDMDFGVMGLAGGITATERANMNATTAGLLSALFHIDCNALTAYASSDDNSSPVAATDLSAAANVLATNKRWKIIVRPTGVVEFWVNEVRMLSTTVFSVGASGLLAGIVNLEKSTGTGVPEARIRKLRVAGAIA